MNRTRLLTITALGTGHLPVAPGTFASALAIITAWGIVRLTNTPMTTIVFAFLALITSALSVKLAAGSELQFGAKDPGEHVIDEVAGQFTTLALALALPETAPLPALILSFLSFRVFDILKPPPIRQLEGLSGGWGVTLDDILAGIYAGGVTILLLLLM